MVRRRHDTLTPAILGRNRALAARGSRRARSEGCKSRSTASAADGRAEWLRRGVPTAGSAKSTNDPAVERPRVGDLNVTRSLKKTYIWERDVAPLAS
jgi:hypothetical protein